jgi:serine O-acetyltransferase
LIRVDIQEWFKHLGKSNSVNAFGLLYLLVFYPQFRNLFYHRIGTNNIIFRILMPPMQSLTIATPSIGVGLFLPHGYGTAIGARSIGNFCSINHNVTIGTFGDDLRPVILNNVRINAGAVIYGAVTIGNNVVIGANATVYTDIPDNSTVFPPASRVVKWTSKP